MTIAKFRAIAKEFISYGESEELLSDMECYDGTFIYGYLADGYILGDTVEATDEYFSPESWIPIYKNTVGQYTGYNDRKENEIYAGDILKWTTDDIDFDAGYDIGYVKMSKGCWMVYNQDPLVQADCLYVWLQCNVEVIGNVYENSDLLSEGEKALSM